MFAGVEDEAPRPQGDSFLGAATRAGQNFVHGAIDPIASVPAALELAARAGQNATGASKEAKIEDTLGFKTTAFLKGLADLVGEADPADQSLGQQAASGAGSVVGVGAPALVVSLFGSPVAGLATGAGLGSAQMSVQMFEEARASGADENTALLYGGAGGVIGLSDILPIGHALKLLPAPLRKEVTGKFLKKVVEIASGAGEEAAQEYGQQVAQNLAANGILKEDRAWDEGALNSAVVGAIVGGGTGAIGSMIPDKKQPAADPGVSSEQKAALDAVAAPEATAEASAAAVTETVDAAPVAPDVAEALETPADKAKRVSKERARKILQEKRAAAMVPAAVEPTPETGAAVELETKAPVSDLPGADTALDEPVPVTPTGNPPATEPAPAPAAEVAPEVAPEESIPTVAESPETIAIQRDALVAGKRMAVLYPWGTEIPAEVGGGRFKRVHIPNLGVIDYDSRKINGATVRTVAKLGKLNEVLDLGPANKADVAQSIEAGSPEVAVTERTPDGVEVKAAAGTEEIAPDQLATFEQTKADPANEVQVETPAEVIQSREEAPPAPEVAPVEAKPSPSVSKATKAKAVSAERSAHKPEKKAGPTLIPDLRPEAQEVENQWKEESQYMRERARAANKAGTETAGKNWQAEQREDRARNNDSATSVIAEYAPLGKTEDAYLGRDTNAVNSRAVIKARASAMVEAAEKAGVKIPERVKDGKDDTMNHNKAVVVLMEARALARKEAPGREDFDRFVTRERLARGGYRAQVVSERKAEGDQKKSTSGAKNTDDIAAAPVTSEVTEGDEVVSAAKLDPGTGDNDVQTKAGKSARMGVRGLNSEGAASGEKLSSDAKAKLIAEMNAMIKRALPRSWRDAVAGRAAFVQQDIVNSVERAMLEKGLSEADVDALGLVAVLSTQETTAGNLAGVFSKRLDDLPTMRPTGKWQKVFAPALLKRIASEIPGLKIYVVADADMSTIATGAAAFYDPNTDTIVLSESSMADPATAFWTFTHEAVHALMYSRLRTDRALNSQMRDILDHVKAVARSNPLWSRSTYGYSNIDEFLSEAWSNPEFQYQLSQISVPRSLWGGLPQPADPVFRNVLNWLKAQIYKVLAITRPETSKTAFEVAMEVGGNIIETAGVSRALYRDMMGNGGWMDMAPIVRMEEEPKTLRDRLTAAGVQEDLAGDLEQLIKDEFGGSATDEEISALAGEFSRPVTSESDLAGKIDATPPPGKPVVQEMIDEPKGGKPTKVRAFFLKAMTLDFMRQKYSPLFARDGKSPLDTFIKWIQRRDAIVSRVADPHDRNAADYIEYARHHPAEATEMADLAMDATRYNVNLGPAADNSHLGVNSKRGLQAKARLTDLQKRFDTLPAEAKSLFNKMTAAYRASHNEAKTKLAGNVLDMLDLTLTPTQRADLIQKVVNGKLTEADKATVGSPTVFRALKNAASLRAIEGAYFPQMRFGDHVVVTAEEIAKPTLTRLMVGGRAVPVTTEVTGPVVRFTADQTIRGVGAELDRQVSSYVSGHDLKSLRVSRRFKDRQTGEFVEKGDQKTGRDYDLTYEVEFQNKGVNYFESKRDAEKFRKASTASKTSPVLERRDEQSANVALEGTDVSAIIRRIEGRTDLSSGERATMKRALEEAVVASMPGNRSPARYQARRNVLGASKDIGRAAATYGRAQGHFIATLETAPKMREAMKDLGAVEADVYHDNAGAVSQVMNELRRRVEGIESPDKPNELAQTIATISFFDKLASPAASVVNAMQVTMNAGPVLGGRYGNARAGAAILSAYHRMGAIGTIGRGIGAAAKSIAQWQKSAIDTSDLLGSVRKKLGPKYDDLLNELISRGALDENAGFEIAQSVMEKKGVVKTNIARFDRAVRQLPNAVEVVNRVVTAVATYDLAVKKGKSPQAAIQEAFDTTVNTQGDYRAVNTPRFMKQGLLSFAMQFRKFALLQTQLYADMFGRIMHGATAKEKAIAGKQLLNLMAMQVLVGGAMGLPGLELIKVGVTLAAMVGLSDDDWEVWQAKMQELLGQVIGKDWANLVSNGVITRAIGVDVSSRMSQADLWTGFAPQKLNAEGITQYLGGIFIGAPGQTVMDWAVKAPQKLKEGDIPAALELLVPVKTLADTVKAWRKYDGEDYDLKDAALQSFGFKSAKRADAEAADNKARGDKFALKEEATKLREAYKAATTNGEKARIKGLIRDYNKRKKPEGVGNISLDALTKPKKDTTK